MNKFVPFYFVNKMKYLRNVSETVIVYIINIRFC